MEREESQISLTDGLKNILYTKIMRMYNFIIGQKFYKWHAVTLELVKACLTNSLQRKTLFLIPKAQLVENDKSVLLNVSGIRRGTT